jgi:hypothetical protein
MRSYLSIRKTFLSLGVTGLLFLSIGCPSQSPTNPGAAFTALSASATIGTSTEFAHPAGMVFLNGNIWILDQGNDSLQQWTTTGTRLQNITTFNTSDTFTDPWGIAVCPITNNIYVTDYNQRVVVFDSTGTYLTQITVGDSDIRGAAFNSAGTTIFVADFSTGGYIYSVGGTPTLPTLTFVDDFGNSGPGDMTSSYQATVDPSGNVWVADYSGARAMKYDANGNHLMTITNSLVIPTSVTVLSDGKILVTDEDAGKVFVYSSTGSKIAEFGGGVLTYPEDVELQGGKYYVSDWFNAQIVVFQ